MTRNASAGERTAGAEQIAVGGERMERSINDFIRACSVHLSEQQENIMPNNALIAVLCDAVRLAREQFPLILENASLRAALRSQPEGKEPEGWTALDGSLTVRFLQYINVKRAERWHGLNSWSALEWAGAMAGEAGEACNAAKKLKRIEDGIANINLEEGRSLTDRQNASAKIVDEIADTVIYGVLLASRVGMDLEEAIRMKFNQKSEEYGFPERIPPNQAPAAQPEGKEQTDVE